MFTSATEPQPRGLDFIGSAAKRHWQLVLALLMVGLAAGALMAVRPDRVYSSMAKVLIEPLSGNPFSPDSLERRGDPLEDVGTEAVIVVTPTVAEIAQELLPHLDPDKVNEFVNSVATPNTQIVEITFTGADPAATKEGADAMAVAFLEYRSEQWRREKDNRLRSIEQQQAGLTAAVNAATARLDAKGTTANERATLARVIASHRSRLAALSTEATAIRSAEPNPGRVIQNASTPTSPEGLAAPLWLALGGLTGLLIGIALAVGREASDTRLRSPSEVESYGFPVIASLTGASGSAEDDEAYRLVRTAVRHASTGRSVIAMAPVTEAVGPVAYSLGLARGLANSGAKVALMIAEPKLPNSPTSGGPPSRLSLLEESRLPELPDGLRVLNIPDSREWFGTSGFDALLDRLSRVNDHVVLASPGLNTPDGIALCASAGKCVLVVPGGVTTAQELETAAASLRRFSVDSLGCLVDMVTARRRGLKRAQKRADAALEDLQAAARPTAPRVVADDAAEWTEPRDAGAPH